MRPTKIFLRSVTACLALALALAMVSACLGKQTVRSSRGQGGDANGFPIQESIAPVDPGMKGGAGEGASSGGAALIKPDICKELAKVCPAGGVATFCELREFSGTVLTPGHRPHAFSLNECQARKAVLSEACNRGWDVKALDVIKCAPDASGQKCPVVPHMCTTEFLPSRCTAQRYAGSATPPERPLVAWGGNSCVARIELAQEACSRNLNPELLQDISCQGQDRYAGDCPPIQPSCDAADSTPAACEVDSNPGDVANVKLSADGNGKCQARFNLNMRVCVAGLSPNEVFSRVSCRTK